MKGRFHIKVCGMKEPQNRESLEELPVDIFGYIFHPASPRFVGQSGKDSISLLASTAKEKAGVFVNAQLETISVFQKQFGLTHAQLHGDESPDFCLRVRQLGLQIIKVFRVIEVSDLSVVHDYIDTADYFLFDTRSIEPGGTGKKFDWKILDAYRLEVPFFLSGGIGPEDAGAILKINHPSLWGLDLNSGFEIRPGMKDPQKLKYFLDQLEP